ncbi:MAG: arginase family protein [Acidobacteria bacterium]|nr:arginase family protein [Acidobacteriota bacterium]
MNLDMHGTFDVVLPSDLVGDEPGSMEAIVRINSAIRDVVADCAARGEVALVLCGDCLSAIGCLAGLERRDVYPFLLWFDAHGDFHTTETTLSGHLGGMPLAMITGRGDTSLLSGVGLSPLADTRVCLIGARDVEPGERELLAASDVLQGRCLADVLERLPKGCPVWVHFDTDYISSRDAPAMRYPASGGPSALDVRAEFEMIARRFSVLGVSISAWAPHLDEGSRTASACWGAIAGILPHGDRANESGDRRGD